MAIHNELRRNPRMIPTYQICFMSNDVIMILYIMSKINRTKKQYFHLLHVTNACKYKLSNSCATSYYSLVPIQSVNCETWSCSPFLNRQRCCRISDVIHSCHIHDAVHVTLLRLPGICVCCPTFMILMVTFENCRNPKDIGHCS